MRFNFDLASSAVEANLSANYSPAQTEESEWIPLQSHPVFSASGQVSGASHRNPKNLIAWDGASRIYFWDPANRHLHRISLRLGDPDPSFVLAASPSKILIPDEDIEFEVTRILISRNGSSALLCGSNWFRVMHLYGHTSSKPNGITCRTLTVGSPIYSSEENSVRVLQILWHPYSSTHIGILSSDAVLRIFNLSSDLLQPEQEYYLQPATSGTATSLCPVDFSFGGDHLWDRFSIFVLYSDGSIYVLCPVVPFGSLHKWSSLSELHDDANSYGRKSIDHAAQANSNIAISWLEATFPKLEAQIESETLSVHKSQPFVFMHSSLRLQGPLRNLHHFGDDENGKSSGRAVSLLYNAVSKDSFLVTSWSSGMLYVDSLADEIQPMWTMGSSPRIRTDAFGRIVATAMICESNNEEQSPNSQPPDGVWLGQSPPLLRIANVDLSLPKKLERDSSIMMFIDPLLDQRIYTMHEGGVDSILVNYLPFTSKSGSEEIREPSVNPVLTTTQTGDVSHCLNGFITMADPFGYSWAVGISSSLECVVLEMKTWDLLMPLDVQQSLTVEDSKSEESVPQIISRDLLKGPNTIVLPQLSPKSVAADSIEGRQLLHHYYKIFHETYVEYANKVHLELMHHRQQANRIIDDQRFRLNEAHDKLCRFEERQRDLDARIDRAIRYNTFLDDRTKQLRSVPGIVKKPLSKAELKFKSELDHLSEIELEALRTCLKRLNARIARVPKQKDEMKPVPTNKIQNARMTQLQSALQKLTLINGKNMENIKALDFALKNREL